MEDSDIVSNFSSIADAPDHLETQYGPLSDVFKEHPHLLPSPKPPESNSDAMIRALKALQEKIRRLEVERVSAANRLGQLERKTAQSSGKRGHDRLTSTAGADRVDVGPMSGQPSLARQLSEDQEDLQRRLEAIDRKFSQQAHELEEMRKQVEEQSKSPMGYDAVGLGHVESPHEKGRHFSSPGCSTSRDRVTRNESPVQARMPLKRKKVRSTRKASRRKETEPL